MKSVLIWLFPGGLFLALVLALVFGVGPENLPQTLGGTYPWVALGLVLILGTFFHRSRVVLFSLGLSGLLLIHSQGTDDLTGLYLAGGFLAGVMGLLAPTQDRGVFSVGGLLQTMAFLLIFLVGKLLLEVAPEEFAVLLTFSPLPESFSRWSGLPQLVFLAFAVSVPLAFLAAVFREGPVERGLFWSLLLLALALRFLTAPGVLALCLTGSSLALGLSVMEISYAMAYKDDLTNLPARRALMRDLQAAGDTYSVAMVDVDHFKKFNDRYGHDVGDQVLRMVAARLASAPGGCKAYRYGGEEFTLLFPSKTVQKALPHLKEVRRSVEESSFILRSWRRPRKKPVDPGAWRGGGKQEPKRLSVTVSIGVADSTPKESSPDAVLKKADRALYRAKESGRNQVAKLGPLT